MNKITRQTHPDIFDELIHNWHEFYQKDHRKYDSFYVSYLILINKDNWPDYPELWGKWNTNTFIWSESDCDYDSITELNRLPNYKAVLLKSQDGDWEGLFVNGTLVEQGHSITALELLECAHKHSFEYPDLFVGYVNDKDEEYIQGYGYFPKKLEELSGNYEGTDTI